MTEIPSRARRIGPVIALYVGFGLAGIVTGIYVYLNSFFASLDSPDSAAHATFAIALPITWLSGLILALVFRKKRRQSLTVGFSILLVLAVLILVDSILLLPLFS